MIISITRYKLLPSFQIWINHLNKLIIVLVLSSLQLHCLIFLLTLRIPKVECCLIIVIIIVECKVDYWWSLPWWGSYHVYKMWYWDVDRKRCETLSVVIRATWVACQTWMVLLTKRFFAFIYSFIFNYNSFLSCSYRCDGTPPVVLGWPG